MTPLVMIPVGLTTVFIAILAIRSWERSATGRGVTSVREFGPPPGGQKWVGSIRGTGRYEIDAVGESHYQRALDEICGGKTEDGHRAECEAQLILDDDNVHDPLAVKVLIAGRHVGHLSRKNAREFRAQLRKTRLPADVPLVVKALIVGGWSREDGDEGHFGVKLDLPTE